MTEPFDMEVFLGGVLTGSQATRKRHLRQATIIHAAIAERWERKNAWVWQRKHLAWFLNHRIRQRSESVLLHVDDPAARSASKYIMGFQHLTEA